MNRILAALLFVPILTMPAIAECVGRDLLADAPAEYLARLDSEAAAQPYAEGRFWQVEKNGRRSVLFGTFHSSAEDVAAIPDDLAAWVEAARVVYVEVTSAEEARMQRALILNPTLILNPDGRSIRPYFSSEEWAMLAKGLAEIGQDIDQAALMQPWFLSLALSAPQCLVLAQMRGELVLDRRIEQLADRHGIEVGGLEEYEAILDIFRDGSFEDQVEMLRLSLPMLGAGEDQIATAKRLYLDGEIWKVWALGLLQAEAHMSAEEAAGMMDEAYEALVRKRNAAWMARILPEVTRGDAVIAVGALHLPGEDGLLRMLEEEGFETRRLPE